jgi:cation-transporting ATPase 13A3/4/5
LKNSIFNSAFLRKFKTIESDDILPGDLISIEADSKITCDIVLVEGNCLVDEAMLTGESIPVTKTAIKDGQTLTSLNVLYAGSVCLLQRDSVVLGMVVNTGWNTFKGKIVSSLVHSKTGDSKIIHQVIYLMSWLAAGSIIILVAILVGDYLRGQLYLIRSIKYATDLLSKSTQPTTIFMLFISVHIVARKLAKREIISVKSNKLFKAGRVDTLCFDKTGTLTKNELLISGMVLPKNENDFTESYTHIKEMRDNDNLLDITAVSCCCHDLHIVNNKLIGDPVDIEVFKYSGGAIEIVKIEEGIKVAEYGQELKLVNIVQPPRFVKKSLSLPTDFAFVVLRVFPFLAENKRMAALAYIGKTSIVADNKEREMYKNESIAFDHNEKSNIGSQVNDDIPLKNKYVYVCKGAPEVIRNMCDPSTVPENFEEVLNEFAQQGMRVISMSIKHTDDPNLEQEDYETDMKFLGFILLSNPVKSNTPHVIEELKFNGIFCAMITGDHLATGVNIGYASQIINFDQSVWMVNFDESTKKPKWKFLTYEDILQNVDAEGESAYKNSKLLVDNKQIKNVDTTEKVSMGKSKFTLSKKEVLSQRNVPLEQYSQRLKKMKKFDLNQIMEDSKDNNFCIAMDGKSVSHFYNTPVLKNGELNFLLEKTKIYGRANPDQKKIVIERLKDLKHQDDLCVGFVGDGANDCKALNRADIGLSIGNAEGSMASPFITCSDDVGKIRDLLELGRFTIANYFDIYFQLNTMNLFETFLLLLIIYLGYSFSNWKYIFDFFFYAPMAILIGLTGSVGFLTPILPDGVLFCKRFLQHFLTLIPFAIFINFFIYYVLSNQYFHKQADEIYDTLDLNMEEIFCIDHAFIVMITTYVAMFETMGVQSSYPFKKPFYTNPWIVSLIVFILCYTILCTGTHWIWSNESFVKFFLIYARVPDIEFELYAKWFGFTVVLSFLFYLFSRYHLLFYLSMVRICI